MADLGKIVYLSEQQKEQLFANDTITVNGVTVDYDANDLYITPQEPMAPLNSPALTGTPTAPTATAGTSNTQIATTAFVQTAISGAAAGLLKRQIVQTLPTQDIDTNTIYMIEKLSALTDNAYNEFMYISNNWELIGDTATSIVVDSQPTQNSTNPISSGAVYTVLGNIETLLGAL